ncbi:unnamed protein product [Phytophthora lilii]|uniref:Unnamed protein product n=1 Tax=Phytophthora lilii TaxID=2077276 RepID=A0A9W6TK36_9STRA|nr:unnamed protein product [Phytophthora lilii]
MTPNVAGDKGYGIDMILEEWRQLSSAFEGLSIQLVRLEKSADGVVLATTRTTTTLTAKAICCAFPQLVADPKLTYFDDKLLNKNLVMNGSVRFHWDNKRGRVASLQYNVDVLTPILKLLGNLEEALCVFNRANLAPDGKINTANVVY